MKISSIKIGNRFRKDIGSLEELKSSIREIGLLQPIVIDESNNLIAGFRRLMACKELDKKDISVNIVNIENNLRGEYDENAIRKDFTPSEAVAIWEAMEKGINQYARSDSEQPIKKASKFLKKSTDTLSKAKQIVESGNQELIQEMDKTGNVNRVYRKVKSIERQKDRILLTPKEIKVDIKLGDFRKLCKELNSNSIDLILTDPPYPKKFLSLWEDLAKEAKRVLKPSGFLISYSGQNNLPIIFEMLTKHLNYYWLGSLYHSGLVAQRFEVNMHNRAKPILFFQKPPYKKQPEWLEDVIKSPMPDKELHEWGQNAEPFIKLLECFSKPNDVILDPFLGGGSVLEACLQTKRNFIGYEVDEKIFKLVKERL